MKQEVPASNMTGTGLRRTLVRRQYLNNNSSTTIDISLFFPIVSPPRCSPPLSELKTTFIHTCPRPPSPRYRRLQNCYWTGFYTSRPGLKRLERVTSAFLQAARQLHALEGFTTTRTTTAMATKGTATAAAVAAAAAAAASEKSWQASLGALEVCQRGCAQKGSLIPYHIMELLTPAFFGDTLYEVSVG